MPASLMLSVLTTTSTSLRVLLTLLLTLLLPGFYGTESNYDNEHYTCAMAPNAKRVEVEQLLRHMWQECAGKASVLPCVVSAMLSAATP